MAVKSELSDGSVVGFRVRCGWGEAGFRRVVSERLRLFAVGSAI
jgi:hypothetical protein